MIPSADTAFDVLPLLREVLALLRHAEDAPLSSGVDAAGIAGLALRRWPRSVRPGSRVTEALAATLHSRLDDAPADGPPAARDPSPAGSAPGSELPDLAAWVSRCHERLRTVHPRAASVVLLRLEGHDDREIARRLDLAPRLVARIRRDLRRGGTP